MPRLTTLAIIGVWASLSQAAPVTFTAAGANSAAIQGTVDAFRTALGTLNANVVGSFGSGRREINWDGVPDALAAPNNLPANFFNVNSPRGVVFSTPGTGFQVSANSGVAPIEFGNINPTYSSLFAPFSAQRLFTALGSNIVDINFFVPGTNTPAFTTGFGSVFSDVDIANATTIQFFNLANASLGTFSAPIGSGNETFSFLGVLFNAGEQVSRVRITSGNSALGPNESLPTTDLVVMDDFIYAEPRAITEPASFGLILLGLLLITGFTRSSAQRASLCRALRPRH
ncbi:MAG: hypothetical protein ACXWCS_21140 [Burkholderiales bacterium]